MYRCQAKHFMLTMACLLVTTPVQLVAVEHQRDEVMFTIPIQANQESQHGPETGEESLPKPLHKLKKTAVLGCVPCHVMR